MGYIKNNAIVVTGTYDDYIERAHIKASEIFEWVSQISPVGVNGSRSFFIPPDGSKEGWSESHMGDVNRCNFIEWLRSIEYDDGSSVLKWVDVWYDDEYIAGIESKPNGIRDDA